MHAGSRNCQIFITETKIEDKIMSLPLCAVITFIFLSSTTMEVMSIGVAGELLKLIILNNNGSLRRNHL